MIGNGNCQYFWLKATAFTGILMLAVGNGAVTWAEQRIDSGEFSWKDIAAGRTAISDVMTATGFFTAVSWGASASAED